MYIYAYIYIYIYRYIYIYIHIYIYIYVYIVCVPDIRVSINMVHSLFTVFISHAPLPTTYEMTQTT